MIKAEHIISRNVQLRADRKVFESHWQECAEVTLPMKDDVTKKTMDGGKHGLQILDNTAIQANEMLAGFLHGFLTNPSEKWFEMTTGDQQLDEDDDVRGWLQDCENRMMNVLVNSNFQTEVHEVYLDLGCFGTAPMSMEEDEKTVIRFASRPVKQVVIDENFRGEVDTFIREFDLEVRQIAKMFGEKKMTESMQKMLKDQPQTKYKLLHAVYPYEEAIRMGDKPEKMLPWVSQYIVEQEKFTIREGGFSELPWVAPRWSKLSGEKYGRSPAMVALPEAKLINKMAETIIRGAQKVVDPPLQLPHDGFILPINTKPGGLNYRMSGTGDRDEIKPIFNDARIDFGNQVMESVRTRIRDAFYQNQLSLGANNPQMTATEVNQRTEEKNRFLGPLLGRQTAEFLRPVIDRLFAIMMRKGMFKPAPQKLAGKKLDVRYSSAIAQVQRANIAMSISKALQATAPFIQMDPSVADIYAGEEVGREMIRIFGAPQRIIRNREDIDKIRQQKAQQQQQAQQLAKGNAVADINQKEAAAKSKLSVV